MKTKLIIASSAVLLAGGIGIHLSGHCPLQQLHSSAAKVKTAPAAVAATPANATVVSAQ